MHFNRICSIVRLLIYAQCTKPLRIIKIHIYAIHIICDICMHKQMTYFPDLKIRSVGPLGLYLFSLSLSLTIYLYICIYTQRSHRSYFKIRKIRHLFMHAYVKLSVICIYVYFDDSQRFCALCIGE